MDFSNYTEGTFRTFPTRVIGNSGRDILEQRGHEYVLIGHTLDYCNELRQSLEQALEVAEKHYKHLVDAGLIVEPLSAEDALKEQLEAQSVINEKLMQTIEALSKKIDNLEKPKESKAENVEANPDKKEVVSSEYNGKDSAGDSEVDKPATRGKSGNRTQKLPK